MVAEFKSQICTTVEQSKRLLGLGLKPETADMVLLKEMVYDENNHCTRDGEGYLIRPIDYLEGEEHRGHIPAWSLHRLLLLLPKEIRIERNFYTIGGANDSIQIVDDWGDIYRYFMSMNVYGELIDCIAWLIKEGYFNKEYLE